MHNNKITVLGSALVALVISGTAGATSITFDSQLDSNGVPMSSQAGVTTINFNNGSCGYVSCSGNYAIRSGSGGGYAAPATGSGSDGTKYLSVPDTIPGESLSAQFSLGTTANYFGLLWGSIDSYNTIDFLLGGTLVDSFTGSDVTAPNAANGNQSAPSTNTYVNFLDLPTFDTVRMTSTSYAFESDNHAFGTMGPNDVPEPGNLALFALAALGLFAGFRRRFSSRAS